MTAGPAPDAGRPGDDAEAVTTGGAGAADAGAEKVSTERDDDVSSPEAQVEPEWVRRRRLEAVFGDGAHGQALGDGYYRDQVPPHHG
ncbi:hypothetical protein [Nocardioides sp. Soil777]|uniref:hypothetical protein n=1 Tax=Nocardioides sp. Soil777 TaxID=1736409 RepID=UPI000B18CA09|nr:hypothetical protein [Nocardioides sp. Soil777]